MALNLSDGLGPAVENAMSVEVHKEPSEMNCWPKENCCVCRTPTSYWYGTGPLNVALCPTCATRATADSLPTKAQWIDAERRANKRPSFAAPW